MTLRLLTAPCLFLVLSFAHAAQVDVATDINKANHDWGTAMMRADTRLAADAHAPDAVFCDAQGRCTTGHDAIETMIAARLSKEGAAKSAQTQSTRRIEDQGWVYEWGEARLVTAHGAQRGGHCFTMWQRQPDGHWKIFRNLVLP